MSKPFHEMSAEELIVEYQMWNKKISEATSWGAALTAADEFRRGCESALHLRGYNTEGKPL